MDQYKIIKYPLATEKAVRLMESENKLLFVVDLKAKKSEIKEAIEKEFKLKVVKVNTLIDRAGHKRAYISISPETPAIDVATQLGLM
jgi:ribosomal protein uL23